MRTDIDVPQGRASEGGFLLIEVMVAILIFSIGILAVVGLQAVMVKNSTDARYRAVASYLAEQRIGEIRTYVGNPTQTNIAAFLENATDISGLLPAGTRTVTQPVAGRIQVTVTWQQPGSDAHRLTTVAHITGGG
jgi:type IV pilus assembly protein PilV